MTSAEDETPERPAPRDSGEGGDWTAWLRSRLERVAPPERHPDLDAEGSRWGDDAPTGEDAPGEEEPGTGPVSRVESPIRPRPPEPPTPEGGGDDDRGGRADDAADADAAGPAATAAAGEARSFQPPAAPPAAPPAEPLARRPLAREAPPAPSEAGGAAAEVPAGRPTPWALPEPAEPLAAVPAHELIAGLDRVQSAVTSLSARVDGLSDAILTFRSVMHERLDEYTETVLRTAKAGASDVQEYRRMHTASLAELRRNANDTAETLRRLTGWMEELARIQGDDERWATALSQAFEEAAAERRGGEAAQEVVAGLTERLERIDRAVAGLGEELAADPPDPLIPAVTSLTERLERVEQALGQLSQASRPEASLEPALASLTERLERIEQAVTGPNDEPAGAPRAPRPGAPPRRAPRGTDTDAAAVPAPPSRSRRTAPIRAPSRSGPDAG